MNILLAGSMLEAINTAKIMNWGKGTVTTEFIGQEAELIQYMADCSILRDVSFRGTHFIFYKGVGWLSLSDKFLEDILFLVDGQQGEFVELPECH